MNERMLTTKEVAATLRTSLPTVSRMIAAGEIPAVRVGTRSWRIPAAAVDDMVAHAHAEAERRRATSAA